MIDSHSVAVASSADSDSLSSATSKPNARVAVGVTHSLIHPWFMSGVAVNFK